MESLSPSGLYFRSHHWKLGFVEFGLSLEVLFSLHIHHLHSSPQRLFSIFQCYDSKKGRVVMSVMFLWNLQDMTFSPLVLDVFIYLVKLSTYFLSLCLYKWISPYTTLKLSAVEGRWWTRLSKRVTNQKVTSLCWNPNSSILFSSLLSQTYILSCSSLAYINI